MLVSHEKKFILFKTYCEMSTAVELAFQKFCANGLSGERRQEMVITPKGIVGGRGVPSGDQLPEFWNHMPAKDIRVVLGNDKWLSYIKIAVIRNPFDNMLAEYLGSLESDLPESPPNEPTARGFTEFIRDNAKRYDNRKIYFIDGSCQVDFPLNYENFRADLKELCKKLDINYSDVSGELPSATKAARKGDWKKLYTQDNIELVSYLFADEIKTFDNGIKKVWSK